MLKYMHACVKCSFFFFLLPPPPPKPKNTATTQKNKQKPYNEWGDKNHFPLIVHDVI